MQKDRFCVIPMASIHPDRINLYSSVEYFEEKPYRSSNFSIKDMDRNNRGHLSDIAKKKLERSVCYLNSMAKERTGFFPNEKKGIKYKVTFITLTLSSKQVHEVNFITNSLLNQFLTEAKKKWNMSKYVWKAEFQRNGNLHYHILTDTFIPHWELKQTWNRIQEKLGYISRYTARTGKNSPNSTDIHNLKSVKNISKYVVKYMSKDNIIKHEKVKASELGIVKQYIKGTHSLSPATKLYIKSQRENFRIWGCSQHFSNIKGAQTVVESELSKEINWLWNLPHTNKYNGEHAQVIYIDYERLKSMNLLHLYNLFYEYLQDLQSDIIV